MLSDPVSIARVKLEKARQRLLEHQIATAEETLVSCAEMQSLFDRQWQVVITSIREHFIGAAPAMAQRLGIDEAQTRAWLTELVEEEINRMSKPRMDSLLPPPVASVKQPRGPRSRVGKPKPKR